MIQDIYIRDLEDPKYNPDKLDHSDEYEMLFSKILMILGTRHGDVLGDPNFGASLEDKLFSFGLSESSVRDEVYTQIQQYIPESSKFNITLDVKRFRGSVRDIFLLDFVVDGRKSFGVMIK